MGQGLGFFSPRRASVRRPASSPGGSIKEPDPSLNWWLLSPFNAQRWRCSERVARFLSVFLRILGEFWVELSVFEEGSVPLLLFCPPLGFRLIFSTTSSLTRTALCCSLVESFYPERTDGRTGGIQPTSRPWFPHCQLASVCALQGQNPKTSVSSSCFS